LAFEGYSPRRMRAIRAGGSIAATASEARPTGSPLPRLLARAHPGNAADA